MSRYTVLSSKLSKHWTRPNKENYYCDLLLTHKQSDTFFWCAKDIQWQKAVPPKINPVE